MKKISKSAIKVFIMLGLLAASSFGFAMESQAQDKAAAAPAPALWKYQCIDTMKTSRDNARIWAGRRDLVELIRQEMIAIKDMGANCVAIGTPYDDEFTPYLRAWVWEARKQNLLVWFRGNLSGWEGWFSYPVLASTEEHHQKIQRFIGLNSDLFQDGDIFTPAPEPENGKLLGDPRNSAARQSKYLDFLSTSFQNCTRSFAKINKNVVCGYFSMNGDIAKNILTGEVVKNIGNVVVIDHYVSTAQRMASDILYLHDKLKAKVMVGEFGAPIPDIHGAMTQDQQAQFINDTLDLIAQHKDIVEGVNYWVLKGGTTALLNNDDIPRKVVEVIKNYYMPGLVEGMVTNTSGEKVAGVAIKIAGTAPQTKTDSNGQYEVAVPAGPAQLVMVSESYKPANLTLSVDRGKKIQQDVTLEPKPESWFYKLWTAIRNFFIKLFSK